MCFPWWPGSGSFSEVRLEPRGWATSFRHFVGPTRRQGELVTGLEDGMKPTMTNSEADHWPIAVSEGSDDAASQRTLDTVPCQT